MTEVKPLSDADVDHARELPDNHSYSNGRWAATITALKSENEKMRGRITVLEGALEIQRGELSRAFEEHEKLTAALQPFAALYDSSKPYSIHRYADGAVWAPNFVELENMLTVGHLRRARAALAKG